VRLADDETQKRFVGMTVANGERERGRGREETRRYPQYERFPDLPLHPRHNSAIANVEFLTQAEATAEAKEGLRRPTAEVEEDLGAALRERVKSERALRGGGMLLLIGRVEAAGSDYKTRRGFFFCKVVRWDPRVSVSRNLWTGESPRVISLLSQSTHARTQTPTPPPRATTVPLRSRAIAV
jgi:hypothetical protein